MADPGRALTLGLGECLQMVLQKRVDLIQKGFGSRQAGGFAPRGGSRGGRKWGDPVKEVILAVMKILLWEEERALVTEMNEYRNNLSRHLLNRLSELGGRPVNLARFGPSFKAGWQEWKKRGDQREESSFDVFLNAMNANTEIL